MKFPTIGRIVLILISLTVTNIYSQGTLKGVVTDSLTKSELIGANLFLQGTSIGAATNIEGKYAITSIPAGSYTVKVSYIGYKPKEYSVDIKAGATTELNVQLSMDVLVGEEVVVTGQMKGQISAINQQLASDIIINVVSEEKIQELPDANAAETIGRLPGVSVTRSGGEANKITLRGLSDKYVNVTIDGVRIPSTDALGRGIDLSTVSQNSLAGIELYKVLTADKDADAIAGSVNLVTKKAPAERQIKTALKGGYNGLMGSAEQYDFSLKYGERFLEQLLGVQFNGNIERKIRSTEISDIDYDQSGNNQTTYFINNFNLRFTDEVRKRNALSLIIDYALPDDGSIMLNSNYNSTSRDYITFERDYPNGGGETQYLGGVTYQYRDREQELETYSSALTGVNNIYDFNITWGLSFAQSTGKFPYDFQLDFSEPSDQAAKSGMRPAPQFKDRPERLIDYAYNNFPAASLAGAFYTSQDNLEQNKSAFLNILRSYVIGDILAGEIKLGGKYVTKSRDNNQSQSFSAYYLGGWQPYQRLANGTIVAKNFTGTNFEPFFNRYKSNPLFINAPFTEFLDTPPDSRLLFDLYSLNPLINRDLLRLWYDLNKDGVSQTGQIKEYNEDPTYGAYYYDITEAVSAGYITNTFKFGDLVTFISGVRVEKEVNDYKNRYSKSVAGGFPYLTLPIRDTTSSYSETIVLPNFHLNIKATDFMSVRIAAYKALARPDFNMRLNTYFAWRPAVVGGNRQLIVGNPKLKTAKAWNYEVNTSFYSNEIGLFSVSAFYKEIADMYHMLNQINTTGNVIFQDLELETVSLHGSSSYQLTVPYNSEDLSKVWGFEVEHQINFAFLPGYLQYIVLSYNASLVRSETQLIGSTTDTTYNVIGGIPFPEYKERATKYKQQLENQPEFFGNIALGYDIGGFSGRVSLFHQSEYYQSFSPSGRGDVLIAGYNRVDVALKQKLTDYLTVIVNLNNLTNLKDVNLIDNRVNQYILPNTSQNYGMTADLGVILEF